MHMESVDVGARQVLSMLGDLDISQARWLLRKNSNCVEEAINYYFEKGPSVLPPKAPKTLKTESSSSSKEVIVIDLDENENDSPILQNCSVLSMKSTTKMVKATGKPSIPKSPLKTQSMGDRKYLLGRRTVYGHATTEGNARRCQHILLSLGKSAQELLQQSMKGASSGKKKGRGASTGLKHDKHSAGRLLFSTYIPSPSDRGDMSMKNGDFRGRLPKLLCDIFVPLLTANLVEVKGHILYDIGHRNVFSDYEVPLSLFIIIDDRFLELTQENSAINRKYGTLVESANDLLLWLQEGEGALATLKAQQAKEKESLKIKASNYGLTKVGKSSGSVQEKDKDKDKEKAESEDVASLEADLGNEVVAEEFVDLMDSTERTSKANDDKNEKERAELPEAQQPALMAKNLVMRKYQLQALYWMSGRESIETEERCKASLETAIDVEKAEQMIASLPTQGLLQVKSTLPDLSNNPSSTFAAAVDEEVWTRVNMLEYSSEVKLQEYADYISTSDDSDSLHAFYWNVYSQKFERQPPSEPNQARGGILADDMGLGKTVMAVALIAADYERIASKDCTASTDQLQSFSSRVQEEDMVDLTDTHNGVLKQDTDPIKEVDSDATPELEDSDDLKSMDGSVTTDYPNLAKHKPAEKRKRGKYKKGSGSTASTKTIPSTTSIATGRSKRSKRLEEKVKTPLESLTFSDEEMKEIEDVEEEEENSEDEEEDDDDDFYVGRRKRRQKCGNSRNAYSSFSKYGKRSKPKQITTSRTKSAVVPSRKSHHSGSTDIICRGIKSSSFLTEANEFTREFRLKDSAPQQTLIVCPLTLMSQWAEEVCAKTLPNSLQVMLYYDGSASANSGVEYMIGRDASKLKNAHVVITSYGIIASEAKQYLTSQENIDNSLSVEGATSSKGTLLSHTKAIRSGLLAIDWRRIILDEAHVIKNSNTDAAKACNMLMSERRWCLTGTPLQNTVDDVYSLVKFLRHDPWSEYRFFKKVITHPYSEGGSEGHKALGLLKRLLHEILLRRTKDTLDVDGKKIVNLPDRRVHIMRVEMNEEEREFYMAIVDRSKSVVNQFEGNGMNAETKRMILRNKYAALFTLLMRMRQACDHPLLVIKSQPNAIDEDDKHRSSLKTTISNRSQNVGSSSGSYNNNTSSGDSRASFLTGLPPNRSDTNSSTAMVIAGGNNDILPSSSDGKDEEKEKAGEGDGDLFANLIGEDFLNELMVRLRKARKQRRAEAKDAQTPQAPRDVEDYTPTHGLNASDGEEDDGQEDKYIDELITRLGESVTSTTGVEECPICLDTKGRKLMSITSCGHLLCTDCKQVIWPSTIHTKQITPFHKKEVRVFGEAKCPLCSSLISGQHVWPLEQIEGRKEESPSKKTSQCVEIQTCDAEAKAQNESGTTADGAIDTEVDVKPALIDIGTNGSISNDNNSSSSSSKSNVKGFTSLASINSDWRHWGDQAVRNCRKSNNQASLQRAFARSDANNCKSSTTNSRGSAVTDKSEVVYVDDWAKKDEQMDEVLNEASDEDEEGALFVSSSKVDAMMLKIEQIMREEDALEYETAEFQDSLKGISSSSSSSSASPVSPLPSKIVIFSQWTSMLDIVQDALNRKKLKFVRLDGSMSQAQRAKSIRQFNNNDSCRIILISLKAGGVGLNLTVANKVILLDPWWNPSTEDQAIDRVHRLGQSRAVDVYRYICSNTVEEKLLALQDKKRDMSNQALSSSGDSKASVKLSMEELRQFFL